MPLPQDGSARFGGVSGPSRRFALIVALLVIAASLPMLATIGAGSATVAENSRVGGAVPFLSQPHGGPVIVVPAEPTPTAGARHPSADDTEGRDGDDSASARDPDASGAGGRDRSKHTTPPTGRRPAPSVPTVARPSQPSVAPTPPDTTSPPPGSGSPDPDTAPSPGTPPPSTDPEVADPEVADPEVADPDVGTDPTECPTPTPAPTSRVTRSGPTSHGALSHPRAV